MAIVAGAVLLVLRVQRRERAERNDEIVAKAVRETIQATPSPPTASIAKAQPISPVRVAPPRPAQIADEEREARVEGILLDWTGRGKRTRFTATTRFTCACGHHYRLSAFGLAEDAPILCPACKVSRPLSLDEEDTIREQLEERLWDIFDEVGIDDSDDDIEFVLEHGRFPKPSEREPDGYAVGLAGEEFHQPAVKACKPGETVKLLREPSNPHDPLAIAVVSKQGATLGYIPRKNFVQRVVHEDGKGCRAKVWKVNKREGGGLDVVLDLEVIDTPIGERAFSQ